MVKYIDAIKEAECVFCKVENAKNLLKNTNMLVEENALTYFEDEQWYLEKNYFKKLLEYKKKKNKKCYVGVDCDVSILCSTMYILLNENLSSADVKNQYYSKYKYEIRKNDVVYKGDTLTSAITSIKLYLGCLWNLIAQNEKLKTNTNYKQFYELFDEVKKNGIPHVKEGEWMEMCAQNSDIIWNVMHKEVKSFLLNYNKFGNYMCIPGCSYKIQGKSKEVRTSFNMSRSNCGKWDTIDTMLLKVYRYYTEKDKKYLALLFTAKQDEIVEETIQWLNAFGMNTWEEFINKNCLEDFVSDTNIPISMKTGKEVVISDCKSYDAMPRTMDECLIFLNNYLIEF